MQYSKSNSVLKIAAGSKTKMGGGKTTRGKKIPRAETTTSSTRSGQTPFRGQEEAVCGGIGGVDGGVVRGEAANSRMQIPKSGICNPSIYEERERVCLLTSRRLPTRTPLRLGVVALSGSLPI